MEDPVKQGMWSQGALGGDEIAIGWGKGREVEGGHWMDARNDREENLPEPRVDIVRGEELPELL
jgi:hypothetical protein